jgi:hypothetical protein
MELRAVVEKDLPWGYQATNVLDHLRQHNGIINVTDPRLKCVPIEHLAGRPVPSHPVDVCEKHRNMQ